MEQVQRKYLEEAKGHFEYMLNEGSILLSKESRQAIHDKLRLINAELVINKKGADFKER